MFALWCERRTGVPFAQLRAMKHIFDKAKRWSPTAARFIDGAFLVSEAYKTHELSQSSGWCNAMNDVNSSQTKFYLLLFCNGRSDAIKKPSRHRHQRGFSIFKNVYRFGLSHAHIVKCSWVSFRNFAVCLSHELNLLDRRLSFSCCSVPGRTDRNHDV